MTSTVRQILALPTFADARPIVHAGAAALDAEVRWVHAVADQHSASLRDGELVLMTIGSLPRGASDETTWIAYLADSRAVGLIVTRGDPNAQIPAHLVADCEARGLPMIELADGVAMSDLVEAATRLIVRGDRDDADVLERMHRRLNDVAQADATIGDVVRQTALIAQCAVVLENLAHEVVAYDAGDQSADAILTSWANRSRRYHPAGRASYVRDAGWLMAHVGSAGDDWGRLILILPQEPSPFHYSLVDHAVSTIALLRMRIGSSGADVVQSPRAILQDLLSEGYLESQEIIARATSLGFPSRGRSMRGLIIRMAPPLEQQLAQGSTRAARLLVLLRSSAEAIGLPLLAAEIDHRTVGAIVSFNSNDEHERMMCQLTSDVTGRDPALASQCIVGLGDQASDAHALRFSLVEARHIVGVATERPARPFYRMTDLGMEGLIFLLQDDARVQRFAEAQLAALLRHDAAYGTQLEVTLDAFLSCGGNKSATAEKLFLARASVYERLGRIERLLSVSLNDPLQTIDLHVAILWRRAKRQGATQAGDSKDSGR